MVVFDASFLLFLFDPNTPASVLRAKDRVAHLIDTLSDAGEKIIVPTPALSECMVQAASAASEYVAILAKHAAFRVAAFDERAAIEAAVRTYEARARGLKKGGDPSATKAKIKFDRQIVAIAAVEGASAVYSDDDQVCAYAHEAGMQAFRLADVPLPPADLQLAIPFGPTDNK